MSSFRSNFSLVSLSYSIVAILAITYICLIAVVMSYATLTVEFSQSVKNNETTVSVLESQYLANVSRITSIDYITAGYTLPTRKIFVPVKSATALR